MKPPTQAFLGKGENTEVTICIRILRKMNTFKSFKTMHSERRTLLKKNDENDFTVKKVAVCMGNSMICSDIWHKYHE